MASTQHQAGTARWPLYSEEFYRELLEGKPSDKTLAAYFLKPYYDDFFGPFIRGLAVEDLYAPLEIFRTTLSIRGHIMGKVDDPESSLGYSKMIASNEGMLAAEQDAKKLVAAIQQTLGQDLCFSLSRGDGYTDELNPEGSFPQAHLLHFEARVTEKYGRWLEPRVEMYNGLGSMTDARRQAFLAATDRVLLKQEDGSRLLVIDVYGHTSLQSDWEDRLNYYSEQVAIDGIGEIEYLVGLIHLSDLLATIHLITSAAMVHLGRYEYSSTADVLTELWLRIYGDHENDNLITGVCEVCHGIFVTMNAAKRGHDSCMNKRRVKRFKARKYAKLIESGLSADEAARKASISSATALELLKADSETEGAQ